MELKKGLVFALVSGEYSDFGITGLFRVLESFDLQAERELVVRSGSKPDFLGCAVIRHLLLQGKIEELPPVEIHIDDIESGDLDGTEDWIMEELEATRDIERWAS